MRYGSLCSGIGGFDLGLDRAGMECAWQVEKNDYYLQVLQKHWPNVLKHKDIRNVGKHNLEPVDLIATGFPCQPHSYAGKRRGAADDRNLWPENRRVIGELRPAWVIIENVPGIKTTILDQVLSDLENLSYSPETFIVPACGFNAPHRRDRILVVAYADSHDQFWRPGNVQVGRQLGQGQTKKNGYKERIKWPPEPGMGGANDGVPARLDGSWQHGWETGTPRIKKGVCFRHERLHALGNAVVPALAEWLGRQIMKVEES